MATKPILAGVITEGYNINPNDKTKPIHAGIDIGVRGNPVNVPVYAAKSGQIIVIDYTRVYDPISKKGSFGCIVYVLGIDGYYSIYAHLNVINFDLRRYDHIEAGTFIGIMGTTGISTDVHLHYEERTTLYVGNSRNPSDISALYK